MFNLILSIYIFSYTYIIFLLPIYYKLINFLLFKNILFLLFFLLVYYLNFYKYYLFLIILFTFNFKIPILNIFSQKLILK